MLVTNDTVIFSRYSRLKAESKCIVLYCGILPDATETVAHGGQTGLKVFIKKLIESD